MELPLFGGWLLRIGCIALLAGLVYINKSLADKYPWTEKYVTIPLAFILTIVTVLVFILTQ